MKGLYITLLTICISGVLSAQVTFEKGYIIDNSGKKIECLIKNLEWQYNPSEFIYKTNESSPEIKGVLTGVSEFGVFGSIKYVRAILEADLTSDKADRIGSDRAPSFTLDTLFLKVINEGEASLYKFENSDCRKFFFSINGSPVKQLIYKKYLADNYNIAENNLFRNQLWGEVRIDGSSESSLMSINYTERSLQSYFEKFNSSKGIKNSTRKVVNERERFNFKLKPGATASSLTFLSDINSIDKKIDQSPSFSLGAELEIFLPFNKNKWSFIVEPTYQYFKGSSDNPKLSADVKSLDLPVGARFYMYLNKNSKLFITGLFIPNFSVQLDSKVIVYAESLDVSTTNSYAVGAGFSWKMLSAEIRYFTARNLVKDYVNWQAKYERVGIILGYRLYSHKK